MRKISLIPILLLISLAFWNCQAPLQPSSADSAARALPGTNQMVIGYMPSWSGDPNAVQYSKLTHINYAFAEANPNGTLSCDTGNLGAIVSKAHSAGVKVLISVGGANNGGNMTSAMRNSRAALAGNIVNFVNTWGLDGADIDWEGPANSSDGNLFSLLIQSLSGSLKPAGKLVTTAVDTGGWFGMYIPSSAFTYLDIVNVMAYDGDGANHSSMAIAQDGLNYWLGRGVPKSKLVLGVPFYGETPYSNGNGAQRAYKDLLADDPDVPYKDLSNGYAYNGLATMQQKAQLAKSSAAGIMIWELSEDATGSLSLLSTIYTVLTNGTTPTPTPAPSPTPPPSTTIPVGKIISLLAKANNQYVCADNYGTDPLIANRPTASGWEQFKVVDMGNGNVALIAQANGKYVCADTTGTSALIANRDTAGTWETFAWINQADGSVSLKSAINGQFVSADLNISDPPNLWANRPTASGWESFTVTVY